MISFAAKKKKKMVKKMIATLMWVGIMLPTGIEAQERTLRLDYIFSGTNEETEISLAQMKSLEGWAGRRGRMEEALLAGNGSVSIRDSESGELLYVNTFSTLFQEWQNTEEATRVRKAFENVFLVPMPNAPVIVTVQLTDNYNKVVAELSHPVDPADILIRPVKEEYPYRYIHKSGDSGDCVDIVIVAEGYTEKEMDVFYTDAEFAVGQILAHEPFASMQEKLNFVAVGVPSKDSGVSVPHDNDWKDTALSSSFDTFYSDRYLTTLNLFTLHDVISAVPYEDIIILANTDTYGGGGIYNSYMLSAAHNKYSAPVIVHEFGHSFAGLADEYFYDDQYEQFYNKEVEPWEPNVTTLVDFSLKWEDILEEKEIITKEDQTNPEWKERTREALMKGGEGFKIGIYEGAGYMSEGAYRPYPECRMKINEYPTFCPVCERAIRRMIEYKTAK